MTRWFTSDQHFGHTNIIRYTGRPYPDAEQMNTDLVRRHNDVVAPGDEVWWLGDVAMGDRAQTLRWVARCHGRKTLVVGNHDKLFVDPGAKRKPPPDAEDAYRDVGFERVVHGSATLSMADGTEVLVCHFPYVGDSLDVHRYRGLRPPDRGRWLLCGHIHEKWRQRGRQINVGVDAWAGFPVSEATLLDLIAQGPANRDRLPWSAAG